MRQTIFIACVANPVCELAYYRVIAETVQQAEGILRGHYQGREKAVWPYGRITWTRNQIHCEPKPTVVRCARALYQNSDPV